MIALLDVNVLIALIDEYHIFHALAHEWMQRTEVDLWATCPITENGTIRILSNTVYKQSRTLAEVVASVASLRNQRRHTFWPDDLDSVQTDLIRWDRVTTARHMTDVYLLALAVSKEATFITFDEGIDASAVADGERWLLVLPTKSTS